MFGAWAPNHSSLFQDFPKDLAVWNTLLPTLFWAQQQEMTSHLRHGHRKHLAPRGSTWRACVWSDAVWDEASAAQRSYCWLRSSKTHDGTQWLFCVVGSLHTSVGWMGIRCRKSHSDTEDFFLGGGNQSSLSYYFHTAYMMSSHNFIVHTKWWY